jgi:hypothetical protein
MFGVNWPRMRFAPYYASREQSALTAALSSHSLHKFAGVGLAFNVSSSRYVAQSQVGRHCDDGGTGGECGHASRPTSTREQCATAGGGCFYAIGYSKIRATVFIVRCALQHQV